MDGIHKTAAGVMATSMQRPEPLHTYRAYQLLFSSEFPIPEMTKTEPHDGTETRDPDVVITISDFPDHLPAPLGSSAVHEVNADSLLIRVAGVGRYLVTEGREVSIDPDPLASDHDIRVYLLGTCVGALLHQRGFLVLHASGIATERGCVLFAGASGAGKSTLLAEFLRRGYDMIVDDVCAVRLTSDRGPTVVPSYPRTRLWADTAARMEIDTSQLSRTKSSWDKFERQVWEQFSSEEDRLVHIFHLAGAHDSSGFEFQRLGSIEAFQTLIDHTYRGILLDGMDLRKSHFELASLAAQSVGVTTVRRPAGPDTVEQLAALILSNVEGQ